MKRLFLVLMILPLLASAQRTIDLGTISRLSVARTIPVAWELKGEDISPVLERALSMNGGFLKVSPDQANVVLQFTQMGAGQVQLQLLGTKPRRVLYNESFQGPNARFAALKAAERAVEKTLGIPGFYTGKVAFVSDRTGSPEVYVSDLLFQNIRQLTSDRALVATPKLSPDGRSLNYTSFYKSGFPDVFRIDLASGRRTMIAGFKGMNSGGTWAPRGNQVALIISSSGNPEVYIADPMGRSLRRLTHSSSVEASPSFSPDGQRVIFASDLAGKPQIYTMDVDGGPMQRVPTRISNYCAEPVWNPRDPNVIAFTAGIGGGFQVGIYDMAKHEGKIITKGGADALEPVWLNDGRHLLYTARTGTTRQIYIIDSETGKTTPLTSVKFGKAYQSCFVK